MKSTESALMMRDMLKDSFRAPFEEFIKGSMSASDAMRQFAANVLSSVAKVLADKTVTDLFNTLFPPKEEQNVGKQLLGAALGGLKTLFGIGIPGAAKSEMDTAASKSTTDIIPGFSKMADKFIPSMSVGNATGNIFSHGNIVPFATGGIVHSPTLFPMAKGTGLMGEAGPEAIIPLKRGRDGKLGVSGGANYVNNTNNSYSIAVTIEKYTGKDDPDTTGAKIAEAIARRVAKEELQSANRSGNMLRPANRFG